MRPELNDADIRHRADMRARLHVAAEHFSVTLAGEVTFGWRDRTIGSRAHTGGGQRWVRVSWSQSRWTDGDWWTGNEDANTLTGIPKPTVLDVHDWAETGDAWNECRNRAELMTLVEDLPCSPTRELRSELDVLEPWWTDLRTALDVLAAQPTERQNTDQDTVTGRLLSYFGSGVDTTVTHWVTAHADLNWSNLTRPNPVLLDWESWGIAPRGYDASTLYVLSLGAPDTNATVHEKFADILDSPDGMCAQLFAVARYLKLVETGDFRHYVDHLHRHARHLLDVLR